MRQIAIRTMRAWEYNLLKNFVYEAIYVPPGSASLPKSITDRPELQVYFHRFGCGRWDKAFVALDGERIVGAIWCRLMDDYGHVDDETPSLAMALYQEYRGCGIGTTLLRTMLGALNREGARQVSLSVQKENRAASLYRREGFWTLWETEEEYIMINDLRREKSTPVTSGDSVYVG